MKLFTEREEHKQFLELILKFTSTFILNYASWKVKVKSHSRVQLFVALWTVAHQPPLALGFSRQEYWSGLPVPSPGDLPDPGIKPGSPALLADALKASWRAVFLWCLHSGSSLSGPARLDTQQSNSTSWREGRKVETPSLILSWSLSLNEEACIWAKSDT